MLLLTRHRCQHDTEIRNLLKSRTVGVTIGNFDGMHLGHQQLFNTLESKLCDEKGKFKILLTLYPHPRRIFSGLSRDELNENPDYWAITPVRQKLALAAQYGFDAVYLLRFSREVQSLTPRQFVKHILVDQLSSAYVVVGDDWRFGKNRAGTTDDLQSIARDYEISTAIVEEFALGETRVSSRVVRRAIKEGDFERLELFLGRPYTIAGLVAHGEKLGRTIGYPTANISVKQRVIPPQGVYAGYAYVDNKSYKAAISLGTRPVVSDANSPLLEAYLIDYPPQGMSDRKASLYGQWMDIEFKRFIRSQQKFENLESLKNQITDDIALINRCV